MTSQAPEDFEWFGALGFPDPKGCAYLRAATGAWSERGDEPPQNRYVKAFLLATNATTFRVLTLDLIDRTLTNSAPGQPEHTRVGYEVLELRKDASDVLQRLRNPPATNDTWRRFEKQLNERCEVLVLAWACWRHGLDAEAQQLYEQAVNLSARRRRDEPTPNFHDTIEKDLGYVMLWRAIMSFGDTSVSRTQLLAQSESIISNYPHSEYLERARQTASVLKRMISEDEAHPRITLTTLDQLPMEQRVREWIFRLRDQNGHQLSQPGWCDIFEDWRGTTNTPAHQLVRLGYAAVPQLIAALEDPTFSRSVGFHRDFYFSHSVLTIGDCAEAILQRIAGRPFFLPRTTSSYMSTDGAVSATRKAAKDWWAEFEKKGEK